MTAKLLEDAEMSLQLLFAQCSSHETQPSIGDPKIPLLMLGTSASSVLPSPFLSPHIAIATVPRRTRVRHPQKKQPANRKMH